MHDEKACHFRGTFRGSLEPENRKMVREGAQLKETVKRVHGYSQAENKLRKNHNDIVHGTGKQIVANLILLDIP